MKKQTPIPQITNLTWQDYIYLQSSLLNVIQNDGYKPEVIICILRGGQQLSQEIASIFKIPKFDVRIFRTATDHASFEKQKPQSINYQRLPLKKLQNKNILIIDDISGTGDTLKYLIKKLNRDHVKKIKTACLIAKSTPISQKLVNYYAAKAKPRDWIVFPWERSRQQYHCLEIIKQMISLNQSNLIINKNITVSPFSLNKNLRTFNDISHHYEITLSSKKKFEHQVLTDNILQKLKHDNYRDLGIKHLKIIDTYYQIPKSKTIHSLRLRETYVPNHNSNGNLRFLATIKTNDRSSTRKDTPSLTQYAQTVENLSFNSYKNDLNAFDISQLKNAFNIELFKSNIFPLVTITKQSTQINLLNKKKYNFNRDNYPLIKTYIDNIENITLTNHPLSTCRINPEIVGGSNAVELEFNNHSESKGLHFFYTMRKYLKNLGMLERKDRKIDRILNHLKKNKKL